MVVGSPPCIRYNVVNLPDTIQFTAGHQNYYTYDASGKKLEVQNITSRNILNLPQDTITRLVSSTKLTTDYCGDAIYQNDTLKEVLTPEGYWQNGLYYYYLKDHQRSTREVLRQDNTVMEYSDYYPDGMRFWTSTSNSGALPYRYNGKELEAMNGLNEYDYGARRRETGIPVWKTMDPLCEIDYSISPYAYAHDNFINRIDPNGMKDGDVDGGTLQEVLCTAPTLQNNGNNYSAFQQLLDYANRNTPQIPRMTPPTPSFNLSVNPNNQTTNDKQTKPKNKEMSDVLKQISAQLYVLGISEASVEVIETSVKGVPTISILFKGEAAFANLAKLTPALKALGPIGFALNLVVDAGKVTNNDESKLKAGVNIAVGVISLWFPEVGIVYMILDHYGAFDGAPINLPNYQPNSICPQDAIRTVIPNYTH